MRTLLIASLAMLGCASARIGTARIAPAGGGEERTFDVEAGHLAGFDSGGRRLQLWTFSNLFAGCESAKLTRALDGAPLLLVAICREPGEGPALRFRLELHKAAASKGPWESFIEGRDHISGSDF